VKFVEIGADDKVLPGEYILHKPTQQLVLCGAFNRSNNSVRVLANGKMFEDIISNFNKVHLKPDERKSKRFTKCKGCRA
tara:strand:+ start:674 stop:910 length:237 start_codon:yes stop_codon:yes gene_type:complete